MRAKEPSLCSPLSSFFLAPFPLFPEKRRPRPRCWWPGRGDLAVREARETVVTLNDVRITTAVLAPLLDAAKDAFMMVLPYLLTFVGVKLAAWLLPVLWRHLEKK